VPRPSGWSLGLAWGSARAALGAGIGAPLSPALASARLLMPARWKRLHLRRDEGVGRGGRGRMRAGWGGRSRQRFSTSRGASARGCLSDGGKKLLPRRSRGGRGGICGRPGVDGAEDARERGVDVVLRRRRAGEVPEDDLEAQLQAMVRVKEAITLRIASSDVTGELPVMKVADNLTFLAEVLVDHALAIAERDLVAKHGVPQGENAGFAVVAYGKFGGIELSYGSDLDLVFVFEPGEGMTAGPKAVDSVRFFTRLAQRLVHLLSAKVSSGHLYEVDLRLRPNGDSGLIAVSFDAFANYQRSSAWTWEHQALLRARVVTGTDLLRERIEALRQEILCRPRDSQALAVEVAAMRNKMSSNPVSQERPPEGWFHLKTGPGAIVDIEFLVQYLSLTRATRDAQLVAESDVINVLAALQQAEVLSVEQEQQLREAYLAFRGAVNKTLLQAQQPWGRIADYWAQLSAIVAIRDQWLPGLRPLPKLETKS